MQKISLLALLFILFHCNLHAQYDLVLSDSLKQKEELYYDGSLPPYEVIDKLSLKKRGLKAKNIVLMIGDGTGSSQVFAGYTANRGKINLMQMPVGGFSITNSSDAYITDSASGATAIASGVKTYNSAIGVDSDTIRVKTILEMAEDRNLATGLIATCTITHATPASFIAHNPSRQDYEGIALDFLETDIDFFVGGGHDYFNPKKRQDEVDLIGQLKTKGYQVTHTIEQLEQINDGLVAGFVAGKHPARYPERGEMLMTATKKALELLSKKNEGFFLMIEGSQIDWGGHADNTTYITQEMYDFDRTVGEVLQFAAQDGETLVIVTADHETGGFSHNGGNIETGEIVGKFTTDGHTAVMVPVFAYGPSAEIFGGIQQNTDIFFKMLQAFSWEIEP